MNRNSKKGFTIVELIIVIAVIAVLAAVLIPTFSNLIQKANVAADTTLIKNLNTALAMDTSVSKHVTMTQALEATKENGFDVEKIVARATDNKIVWDSVNDCFAYSEKDKTGLTYIPDSKTDANVEAYQLWTIVKGNNVDDTYSSYIAGTNVTGTIDATKGVDVGENKGITSINYKNDSGKSQSVVIRTLGNMCELTIDAPLDHVEHYGYAKTTQVLAVNGEQSYHEYGTSSELIVTKGKVVIENSGVVFKLSQAGSAQVNVSNNGGNVMASTITSVVASDTFEINNLAQLEAFRDATNSGETFKDKTINLNCDITLTKAWRAISNYSRNNTSEKDKFFSGIFDGKNHTIDGLTNVGLGANDVNTGTNNSTPQGGTEITYGFFASVNGATIKNVKFKNVKITNAGFGDLLGDSVGACVGFTTGESTIDNIHVHGLVEGYECVGGVLGRDAGTKITIKNCINEANVFANGGASGIACRLYQSGCTILIDSCTNKGTITSNYEGAIKKFEGDALDKCYAVGIVEVRNTVSGEIKNCINEGTIRRKNPTEGKYIEGHIGEITIDSKGKLTKNNNQAKGSCETI